ncbi:hypothetical protein BC938DRAFT_477558 [Jimgerdemannia flammicorona]|uniref:Uncharacterized protein n=1 Tax=Jimgerdemannia flammicorona TaxID=994334 RepID=A0A433QP62_9FUNG|nr:hypothetical protein BC938DRAFT_477558 [Jimgerdemannia flammicorona]
MFALAGSVSLQSNHRRIFFSVETSPGRPTRTKCASILDLPCNDDRQLKPLLLACSGQVGGLSPCHLQPDDFSLGFHPMSYGIMEDVCRHMAPAHTTVVPELSKLSIHMPRGEMYQGTPGSSANFLLIACLPTKHCSGQLVVRHGSTASTFDWSSDAENVQWVAFRADCPYDIRSVGSGSCVTLTYNLVLHQDFPTMSSIYLKSLPIYETLNAAIIYPSFMRNGGILGFGLQHEYPLTPDEDKKEDFPTMLPKMLKGCDWALYAIAKDLRLDVRIAPIFKDGDEDGELIVVGEKFNYVMVEYEVMSKFEFIKQWYGATKMDISWCVVPQKSVLATTYYHIDDIIEIFMMAALLITIPPFVDR